MDLVSIISPTYNSALFLSEMIESVQKQTHKNWELLIVDDCSIDQTAQIVKEYFSKDPRIKFYQLSENSGTGIARNLALEKASGNYIAFLDSDDIWKPEKLQKQLAFLKKHNLPFTFSFYDCIDESGNDLKKRVFAPQNLSYQQLFLCNFIGNLTGIYSVEVFGKIPISHHRKRQDWIMWLTILKSTQIGQPVPESLAFYRVRENSLSASKIDLLKHNFGVYRNFHGFNLPKSIICMFGFLFVQLVVKPFYVKKIKASI